MTTQPILRTINVTERHGTRPEADGLELQLYQAEVVRAVPVAVAGGLYLATVATLLFVRCDVTE